jgi:hypothetical protein
MLTNTFYGDRLDFCNGTADTTLRLIVAVDGTVTGEAELTGPEEKCEATSSTGTIRFNGPDTDLTYEMAGTKTPTEFRFTLVQVFQEGETFANGLVRERPDQRWPKASTGSSAVPAPAPTTSSASTARPVRKSSSSHVVRVP